MRFRARLRLGLVALTRSSRAFLAATIMLRLAEAIAGGAPPSSVPADSTKTESKTKAEPPKPEEVEEVLVVVPKERKHRSEFLSRPGLDRYDTSNRDWNEIPDWRQAAFFGVRAEGLFFVFVVDCSGSMLDDDRLTRAKAELRRSIARMKQPQRFKVIFYNDQPMPMPGGISTSADLRGKTQLNNWLKLIEPDGGTDPRSSVGMALNYRPDAVFLLSDGEYPEGTVEAIGRKNPRRIPIHCIDLSGGAAGDQLKRIAQESGGQYSAETPTTEFAPINRTSTPALRRIKP